VRTAEITLWILSGLTVLGIGVLAGRPRRADLYAGALLAATAIVWFFDNTRLEGHVMWKVTSTHGVTVGDFAGIPAIFVALALAVRAVRTPRQRFGPPLRSYSSGRRRGM
jgi:hypothetical protein